MVSRTSKPQEKCQLHSLEKQSWAPPRPWLRFRSWGCLGSKTGSKLDPRRVFRRGGE